MYRENLRHKSFTRRTAILGAGQLAVFAVLAVLCFHCRVPGFRGGFIGVDIFFVISGFLISQQIHNQIRAGTFSYAGFFARRARRAKKSARG